MDFVSSDFLFVENEIKSSIDDLKQKLCGTVKDINPELSDKINKITNEVCEDILKNAKEDTAKINNIISEKLKIPENVLLYADHAQAKMTTKEDIGDLQREIEALELTTTDVRMIKRLKYLELISKLYHRTLSSFTP